MDTIAGLPNHSDAPSEQSVTLGSPNEYLDAALAAGRLFRDALPSIERTEILNTLLNLVAAPSSVRVVLISGSSGAGKTTLLASMAEAFTTRDIDKSLRFASDGAQGTPHTPRLPQGECVIVIDDAHRRPFVTTLMQQARDRNDVRFVLTTRPGGVPRLLALCAQLGLSANEYRTLPLFPTLGGDGAERATREALGDELAAHATLLVELAKRRLLSIAIATHLTREEGLHPTSLEHATDFDTHVIERSYDALVARMSSAADPKIVSGLLGLIATLGPIRTSDERFLQSAGDLLGCRRRDLVSALRALEHAAILDRCATGVRIVPSALADHAICKMFEGSWPLSGSTAEKIGTLTGHFGIHVLVALLRNVTELDGPSVPANRPAELVRQFFDYCKAELEASSMLDRCRLLGILREVAVDLPTEMLDVVRAAMQLRPPNETRRGLHVFLSETNASNELPAILQRIALHAHHRPNAFDLLWQLGRDDVRLQSPHPDHPMRVLRDFASRTHSRPLGFHEGLLECVDRWLTEPQAHEHKHSPIEVLDTFLAESDCEDEDGAWVTRLLGLRNQALQALALAGCSSNRRAALSGVSGLESVLANASISSSIGFPEPVWRNEERLGVLAMLRQIATNTSDPFVHFAVADVFRWTAHRTTIDAIRTAAELALTDVPDSPQRWLFEALTQRPPPRPMLEGDLPPSSAGLSEQRIAERRGADVPRLVVKEWIDEGVSADVVVRRISEALDVLSLAGKSGSPRRLLQVLSLQNPRAGASACNVIMREPTGPLGPHIAALLHTLRESAPERAAELLRTIVSGADPMLCASVAQAFPRWVDKPRNGDFDALRELLEHQDDFVRRAALGALRTLAKSAPRDAMTLALEVDLSEGLETTEALFAALDSGKLFAGEALSLEDIAALLSRLQQALNLDGHCTLRFLHLAGKRLPKETALLLLDRIGRLVSGEVALADEFTPLPSEDLSFILARLPEIPEWLTILRRIRDLSRSRSSIVRQMAAQLFHSGSKNYSPPAIELLSEWIHTGHAEELEAVATLLEQAPVSLLFSHVGLVATLLRRSHALGAIHFEIIQNKLLPVAMGQTRHHTTGPHPSEATLRAQAREAALKLPPKSPEQRFFETIAKQLESMIADANEADHDDLFDL